METLLNNIWIIIVLLLIAIIVFLVLYFGIKTGTKTATIIALLIALIGILPTFIFRAIDNKKFEDMRIKFEDMCIKHDDNFNQLHAEKNHKGGKYFISDSLYKKISPLTQQLILVDIERNEECLDLLGEANDDVNNGNYEQAKDKLERIHYLNPEDPKIEQQIVDIKYLIAQKKEQSVPPTIPTERDNREVAREFNNKGLRYSALGNAVEAIKAYDKAIEFYSNYYQPFRNRSIQYGSIGQYDAALKDADKAVSIMRTGPNYEQRGDVNFELGNYSVAIRDYESAIEYYGKTESVTWSDGRETSSESTNNLRARVLNKLRRAEALNKL